MRIRGEGVSTISGWDFTDSIINNVGRVVTVEKKRAHFGAFVRKINNTESNSVVYSEKGKGWLEGIFLIIVLNTVVFFQIAQVEFVLYFDCSEERMKERLMIRAESSGRADDNLETILKRLKVFSEQTVPVIDYFKEQDKVKTVCFSLKCTTRTKKEF